MHDCSSYYARLIGRRCLRFSPVFIAPVEMGLTLPLCVSSLLQFYSRVYRYTFVSPVNVLITVLRAIGSFCVSRFTTERICISYTEGRTNETFNPHPTSEASVVAQKRFFLSQRKIIAYMRLRYIARVRV